MSSHIRIPTLDLGIIIAYVVAILAIGILSTLRVKVTGQVFFMAGRSLPWGIVGAALFASNISTIHLVGLTASGYGPPAWHPAPDGVKHVCAQAASYCRQQGSDISKLAMQFALANPKIATTLVGMASSTNIARDAQWADEPIDWQLLTKVREMLRPIQDETWVVGKPENNQPAMLAEYIDAHHHPWMHSEEQYPWMLAGMESIQRDFLIPELYAVTREAGVTGTVAVQARQTIEETEWLLGLARDHELIRGVVGWVPSIDADVAKHLENLSASRNLKGTRHVLHDESDDFYMLRDDFNHGISRLNDLGQRYDILILERHLPQTIRFVDRHPNELFIVDHIAKPRIKDRVRSPWEAEITELARRENAYCKLSGMATEAEWKGWTESDMCPHFDTVLAAFGPKRLMLGSDWPVIQVACSYKRWGDMVRSWIAELSPAEQLSIMSGTAKTAYSL